MRRRQQTAELGSDGPRQSRTGVAGVAVLAGLLLLSGCASYVDYTLARTAGEDCQWLRVLGGEPVCHPYQGLSAEPTEGATHCYRTLGEVSCYREPEHARATIDRG